MNNKRNQKKKRIIYPGTDRLAFFRAGIEGKNSKKREELYAKYAHKKTKILSPYFPRQKIKSPIKKTPTINQISKRLPKNVKPFYYKQPLFFQSKLPKKISNQLQKYFIAKITSGVKKTLILAVKCALANYLPIELFEKLATAHMIVKNIETYIKIGQKVYKIIVFITKKIQESKVKIWTFFSDIDYIYEDYVQFYKNNLSKIRQMPEQINNEIEEQINNETIIVDEIPVEKIELENKIPTDIV